MSYRTIKIKQETQRSTGTSADIVHQTFSSGVLMLLNNQVDELNKVESGLYPASLDSGLDEEGCAITL